MISPEMIWIHFFLSEVEDDFIRGRFSWDLRLAYALWKIKRIPSVLIRVSNKSERYSFSIKYFKFSEKYGSYGIITINLCDKVKEILSSIKEYDREVVLYVHEWRALNSLLLLNCLRKINEPIILQQHVTANFIYRMNNAHKAGKWYSALFYRYLSNWEFNLLKSDAVKAIYFLNKLERNLYRELFPEKIVRINTMGVFFPDKPPRKEEKERVHVAYIGPLVRNSWRGGDLVVKFFKTRGANLLKKVNVIFAGLSDLSLCKIISDLGMNCLGYLRYKEILKIMKNSDILLWPASRTVYWGGIGVTLMEAFANDTPVASPTLINHEGNISPLGWLLPWREYESLVMDRLYEIITLILEDKAKKHPFYEGKRYYDWEVIIDKMISDAKR